MVGQWALVKLQSDDACAVCGTVFAVAGWVCATTGVGDVVAGAVLVVGDCAVTGDDPIAMLGEVAGVEGAVFTATGDVAGCVVATGAEAAGVLGAFCADATVFAMATSVLPMPFSVACTAVSCEGVSVVFAAIEAFNCPSVAASVPSVALNWLTCAAESPVDAGADADVVGALGATATPEPLCEPVPAIEGGTTLGVPASAGGTTPASISRLASVALASASSCSTAATCAGVSVCEPLVAVAVWACAASVMPPMLAIATITAAKNSNLFIDRYLMVN